MIKLLATFTLLFITLNLFSQDVNKDSYGISIGSGQAGLYTLGKAYVGGPDYEGLSAIEAGFNYYHPLNKFLYFESGLYYHHNKIKITPAPYPGAVFNPRYTNLNPYVNIHELYKLDRHDLGKSILGDGARFTLKINPPHIKAVSHK